MKTDASAARTRGPGSGDAARRTIEAGRAGRRPPHAVAKAGRPPAAVSLSLSVQYAVEAPALPRWRLRRWIARALEGARDDGLVAFQGMEISLRIVGLAEGRRLNRDFRGRDYATNVLTFEYGVGPDDVARGDIVLCLPVLRRESREQRKTPLSHAAHLTVHGTLHALGYDHIRERDARRMEGLETRVLAGMGIADPYSPR